MKKLLIALLFVTGAAWAQTNQYYGIKTQSQIYQNSLGHIVFVDSSTGPVSLATLASGGSVPNVAYVSNVIIDSTTVENTFQVAQDYQVTIKPASVTSLVKIEVSFCAFNDAGRAIFSIMRDNENILSDSGGCQINFAAGTRLCGSMIYIDNPATISTTTYAIGFASYSDGGTTLLGDTDTTTTLVATEIRQ